MPLTELDKSELAQQFQLLGDLNEPEALLSTLQRACARAAQSRQVSPDVAKRWSIVANALLEAEATVNASQSPEARKLQSHMAQWSGQDHERTGAAGPVSPEPTPDPPAAA